MRREFDGDGDDYTWLESDDLEADYEVFFDPEISFEDPVLYSVGASSWSNDGNYWAYSVNQGGSDWETVKVRDALTKTDLEDELNWVKFSDITWLPDNEGFLYVYWDEPEDETMDTAGMGTEALETPRLMYHKVGTD
jgi:prolyl oligopeptidase